MKMLTVKSTDDLISDFLEICGREGLNTNYVLSVLMFMFITNESFVKDNLKETFSSLKICYGDID